MTSALISPQLIKQMRTIANRALQTKITLLRRMPVGEGVYGDDEETWATVGEFEAWVKQPKLTPAEVAAGTVVAAVGVYRLHR